MSNLIRIAYPFSLRIDEIASTIALHPTVGSHQRDLIFLNYSILRLQLEWESFIRRLVCHSATGKFKNSTGTVRSALPQHFHSARQVEHYISQVWGRKGLGPNWSIPAEAIGAVKKLRLSNSGQINAVLGSTPWPLEDLRLIRNFVCHRSTSSATRLRSKILTCSPISSELTDCVFVFHRGVPLYQYWIDQMRLISEQLVI